MTRRTMPSSMSAELAERESDDSLSREDEAWIESRMVELMLEWHHNIPQFVIDAAREQAERELREKS